MWICLCVYVSFQFYQCLHHIFFSSVIYCIHILDCYDFFLKLHDVLLCPVIFFAPKSTLSDINRAITAFLWLMLAWYILFLILLLTTCLCYYIWSEFLVDSIQLGHSHVFKSIVLIIFLVGMFIPFIRNVTVHSLRLGLPFYFLFSVCMCFFLSLFFIFPAFLILFA